MSHYRVKRGYDVPMTGTAAREVVDGPAPDVVSMRPNEFRNVKPKILVKEGEPIAAGQPLFHDRQRPEIRFPSPGGGEVVEVRFGRRRVCEEIVVRLAADEPFAEHRTWTADEARALTRAQVVEILLDSGLWTTLRQRPYHVIPDADAEPVAIFVAASDDSPLPCDPTFGLEGRSEDFQLGIDVLGKLTSGGVHVLTLKDRPECSAILTARNCETHTFSGPYPAGLVEAQMHLVRPLKKGAQAWYLDAQDVAGIGELLRTGRYPVARVVAVGGENASQRRHFRTRRGVSVRTLLGAGPPPSTRIISGNVLRGRAVGSSSALGHWDTKFCLVPEGDTPEFVGWMKPGFDKLSRFRVFASSFVPGARPRVDTNLGGGVRAHVATEIYEQVCAVDILPAYLMKSLVVEDVEETERLGLADCAECGLCTFVCPSKIEFGEIIAAGMERALKEG